ncbi:uncharacterized protein LOC120067411 [Benincasa hispida]|uniref:uncharacterized protein LOC120067411 n=1 Tax=Benincasa hispida TaxID=102211 RepID=UPI001900496D|nr:uncharacterized protein LOC120067411 [Benincasa hispida]
MADKQANQNLAQQLAHAAQNPIIMANSSTRPMREYASPGLYDFSPTIIYPTPDGTRFEMKSVMLQMLQTAGQFRGARGEDPHAHMKCFLETCNSFVIPGITPEAIRLSLFPYSLRDDAKQWMCIRDRNRASQMVADAAAAGSIMDKSYTEAKEILDHIAKHNMEWVDDTYDARA